MTEHPAAVLTVALIAFGILAQIVIWGWTQTLRKQRRDHFYVVRRRGKVIRGRHH